MRRKMFFILILILRTQIYSKPFDLDLNVSNYNYLYKYNSICNITNINFNFTYKYKTAFLYLDIPFSIENINLLDSAVKSFRFNIDDITTFLGYCHSLSNLDFNYYLGLKFNTRYYFYQHDENELFINNDNEKTIYSLFRYQIVFSNEPFIIKPALQFSFDILKQEEIYKSFILSTEMQTICLINKDISYFFIIKYSYFFDKGISQIDINNSINFLINNKIYIRPGINCIYKNSSILIGMNLTFSY